MNVTYLKDIIIEVGIKNLDSLAVVKNEKLRKYDLLANELGIIHNARTKIILYVMTWDGVATRYHKRYIQEIGIADILEAYIQSVVLKKTLESISIERRRRHDSLSFREEEIRLAIDRLIQVSYET